MLRVTSEGGVIHLTDGNRGSAVAYPPYNYIVISYASSQATARYRDDYQEYVLEKWNVNCEEWEKTIRIDFARKVIEQVNQCGRGIRST